LSSLGGEFRDRPFACFVGLTTLSTLAYVPLALTFTPWDWASWGPFSFQLCRPLHYLVYFFAGFCIGAYGLERGILRCDGPLARGWLIWLLAALTGFAVWGGLTSLTLQGWDLSPFPYRLAAALAFPLACAAGALSMLAICLRVRMQERLLDSLSNNAYRIYLLHYGFVVWLQYALLGVALTAVAKGMIVFAGALALSWAASSGLAAFHPRHLGPLGKRASGSTAITEG
jgi:surface polysaccharide O-acyltransferase-like enzyme